MNFWREEKAPFFKGGAFLLGEANKGKKKVQDRPEKINGQEWTHAAPHSKRPEMGYDHCQSDPCG